MTTNIIEIEGKPYLELPCKPGDTAYIVGGHVNNKFEYELKVYPHTYITVAEIVKDLGHFGSCIFTTPEAAESHKKM